MDELIKEYNNLGQKEFMVQMADHLDSDDYRFLDEIHQRKMAIKRELEEQWHVSVDL